jgi:GNAT superfamily N-acetyltransferase
VATGREFGGRHSVYTMSSFSFAPVPKTEEARAYQTLVSAFADDPVERWLYPELPEYLTHFPEFLAAFGGRAFDKQTVWGLSECSAVALWLPPGEQPDGDAIGTVLRETVSSGKHGDTFAVLEQMDAAHPTYPHWYLPWFGVVSVLQGRGLGGELIERCLEIVDGSHLPAYLETPNPRTLAFYRRHGFEETATAQAGACPPITFMLRDAR